MGYDERLDEPLPHCLWCGRESDSCECEAIELSTDERKECDK